LAEVLAEERKRVKREVSAAVKQPVFFDTTQVESNLKMHSVQGGAILLSSQLARFLLQMCSVVILARLLTPRDYGLVAMVTAVVGFLGMFKDMGLSMATVQRTKINHTQVSTLFWINVMMGVIIALLTASLAPIIAWFYNEPRLILVTLGFAGVFIFGGLMIQHYALLKRQMRFGTLAFIDLASLMIGIAVAVILAWYGTGYWSLVLMQLSMTITMMIGVWVACGWRPGMPVRQSSTRSSLAFGGYLTGFDFINYFARNLDKTLIGWQWGADSLGLYSRAYTLMLLPINAVRDPIMSVAIPVLSRLKNEPERYVKYYKHIVSLIAFVSMPFTLFIFTMSEEIIVLVLGPKWAGVSPILRILSVAGFFQPVVTTNGIVYISLGQAKRLFRWGLMYSATLALSFVFGLAWGTLGVATGYVVVYCLIIYPSLSYCFKCSPVKMKDFGAVIWRPALCSIVAGGIVYFCRQLLSKQFGDVSVVIFLVAGFVIYLLMWLMIPGGLRTLREYYGIAMSIFGR
jgi:O-antigen/teichoic acid export membrane protein